MSEIKVRLGQQPAIKVISSLAGARGLALSELSDVNIQQNLSGGELLVYNAATHKWDSTKYLTSDVGSSPNDANLSSTLLSTNQIEINGGNF